MKLSQVSSKYGAPMGRRSDQSLSGKTHLRRVPLDSGGYDSGGAYWGHGEPLYWAVDQYQNAMFFRAKNRQLAKASVLASHPEVKFYR